MITHDLLVGIVIGFGFGLLGGVLIMMFRRR